MRFIVVLKIFLFSIFCFLLSSCSLVQTSRKQKAGMRKDYLIGNFAKAYDASKNKALQKMGNHDRVMWELECGSLAFYNKDYQTAIKHLDKAKELIEEYDEYATVSLRDVSSEMMVLTTNLNALPYRGYYRDRMMIPILKAFCYLGLNDSEGFRTEAFAIRQLQKDIIDNKEDIFAKEDEEFRKNQESEKVIKSQSTFTQMAKESEQLEKSLENLEINAKNGYANYLNPLASFISALVAIRENDYENALVDLERMRIAMPKNPLVLAVYCSALKKSGREIPSELQGVKTIPNLTNKQVYVFFANGIGADLEQINIYWPIMVAWPMCKYYQAPYGRMRIVAGEKETTTTSIVDFDAIMAKEYKDRLPGMITRIILSTIVKETAAHAARRAARDKDHSTELAVELISIFYRAAMNTADTRTWSFLPKEIQAARLPIPDNRLVKLHLSQMLEEKTVEISADCDTAIIFVHAPSNGVVNYHTFELKTK